MKTLFLADQFADAPRTAGDPYPGGAELTDKVAIAACPWPIETAKIEGFDPSLLREFELVVVGNAARASEPLLAALVAHGRHVLFEHDLRICLYNGNFPSARDPVHRSAQRCWCPHGPWQRVYDTALGVVYLTELQRRHYEANPYFRTPRSAVLGCSLFSKELFERHRLLRSKERRGTCVMFSRNAIKGYREAVAHCRRLGITPIEIRDRTPEQVLDLFEFSERFVYLPIGLEPAGRMPVEARLLGCEVIVNDNVGVAGEPWWSSGDRAGIGWLEDAPARFWREVEAFARSGPQRSARGSSPPRLVTAIATTLRRSFIPPRLWSLPTPQVRRRRTSLQRVEGWEAMPPRS